MTLEKLLVKGGGELTLLPQQMKIVTLATVKLMSGTPVQIEATMRFGKTVVGVALMDGIGAEKVLVVAPRSAHAGWKKDVSRFSLHSRQVLLTTYHSLPKLQQFSADMIILDEVHRATPRSLSGIDRLRTQNTRFLLLTATPLSPYRQTDREKILALADTVGFPYVIRYTMAEAIQDGLSLLPVVVPVTFELFPWEREAYERASTEMELVQRGSEQYKMLAIKRMRLLHGFLSRHLVGVWLLRKLSGRRVIVFTDRIEMAKAYSEYNITSRSGSWSAVEDFNSGKVNVISSVRMIREGITLHEVDAVLLTATNSDYKDALQKIGRALDPRVSGGRKQVYIFVLQADGTRDLSWVTQALLRHSGVKRLNDISVSISIKPDQRSAAAVAKMSRYKWWAREVLDRLLDEHVEIKMGDRMPLVAQPDPF